MPVESATDISTLVPANPLHSDGVNQGDSHLRMIKSVLQTAFPSAVGSIASWTAVAALGGSGSATVPSVYLNGTDPTAGFYWAGTGQIGVIGTFLGGTPTGAIIPFGADPGNTVLARSIANGGVTPTGKEQYLMLDGNTYTQALFPKLYAMAAGTPGFTVSGTNFTVPNLQDTGRFLRMVSGNGNLGAKLSNQNGTHTHSISDPGHSHGFYDVGHTHGVNDPSHAHSVYDPGHSHTATVYGNAAGPTFAQNIAGQYYNPITIGTSVSGAGTAIYGAYTGISIQAAGTGASVLPGYTNITTTAAQGGTETRPEAYCVYYTIKT